MIDIMTQRKFTGIDMILFAALIERYPHWPLGGWLAAFAGVFLVSFIVDVEVANPSFPQKPGRK